MEAILYSSGVDHVQDAWKEIVILMRESCYILNGDESEENEMGGCGMDSNGPELDDKPSGSTNA